MDSMAYNLRIRTKLDLLKQRLVEFAKEFDSSKHPRDNHGRFAVGSSSSVKLGTYGIHEAGFMILDMARSLNFDFGRLSLKSEKEGRAMAQTIAGGNAIGAASGWYDPATEMVNIVPELLTKVSKSLAEGVVSHEIAHAKFHNYSRVINDDLAKLSKESSQSYDLSRAIAESQITGNLREPYGSRFPVANKYMELMGTGPAIGRLGVADGVTEYSTMYWEAAAGTRDLPSLHLAINETLSEMARLKYQSGGVLYGGEAFRNLYQEIDHHWQRHRNVGA